MSPDFRTTSKQNARSGVGPIFLQARQGGFSIVAAIFILVVLAGLGGFIVSTSSTQHLSLAMDAQNSRAQQAARAGIDWGIYQVLKAAGGGALAACQGGAAYAPSPDGASADCAASPTAACQVMASSGVAGDLPGLDEFTVKVQCDSQSFTEGAASERIYQIVATACNAAACPAPAPTLGYVEHRQLARVRQ